MKRNLKRLAALLGAGTMVLSCAMSTAAAGLEDIFDPEYYASTYSDLEAAYGHDAQALLKHYQEHGMKEGRKACPFFDAKYYRERYSDLDAAFGDDLSSYYVHFVKYGIAEGRIGSENGFDAKAYLNRYSDLQESIGDDPAALLEHYVEHGYAEGRDAKPEPTPVPVPAVSVPQAPAISVEPTAEPTSEPDIEPSPEASAEPTVTPAPETQETVYMLSKIYSVSQSGDRELYSQFECDENGNILIERDFFGWGGDYVYLVRYCEYDSMDRLIKRTIVDADPGMWIYGEDLAPRTEEYFYNEEGRISRAVITMSESDYTNKPYSFIVDYEYDTTGRPLKCYNSEANKIETHEYDGNIDYVRIDGGIERVREYNDEGKLVCEEIPRGGDWMPTVYEYNYDDAGNLIEKRLNRQVWIGDDYVTTIYEYYYTISVTIQ